MRLTPLLPLMIIICSPPHLSEVCEKDTPAHMVSQTAFTPGNVECKEVMEAQRLEEHIAAYGNFTATWRILQKSKEWPKCLRIENC